MPGKVELSQQAWDAIQARDLDAFLTLVDEDVEFTSLVGEAEGGTYRGHDGVRKWWHEVGDSLGGLRFDAQEHEDLGNGGVLTRALITGTAAGVDVQQQMWQVTQLAGGKAIWWGVFRTEDEARESFATRPGID
jgi:ketosteroid isomerase-like protein